MYGVKVRRIGEGMHPSEILVAVDAVSGEEVLEISRHSLDGDTMRIGYPVGMSEGVLLVEFPRETVTGAWRAWVPETSVVGDGADAGMNGTRRKLSGI
jgi:hypothetical protein